jgi:two-component system sensor histidine kinase KdpD
MAMVDGLRLEQVVTNLVDNAIKYSPEGSPVEVSLDLATPETAEIAVRDHGGGIPTDRRAAIFQRYYRAHADTYQSGLGLGLYISRQIVELHGGTISAEFPDDGGSRFVVRLPLVLPTAES